jgi:hypothetical protein
MDPVSAAISTVSVRLIMGARAVAAPSCSGFTIGQSAEIMGACPHAAKVAETAALNIKFNLMVSADCEPTSASRLSVFYTGNQPSR